MGCAEIILKGTWDGLMNIEGLGNGDIVKWCNRATPLPLILTLTVVVLLCFAWLPKILPCLMISSCREQQMNPSVAPRSHCGEPHRLKMLLAVNLTSMELADRDPEAV